MLAVLSVGCSVLVKYYFAHKKFKASYIERKTKKNVQSVWIYLQFWTLAVFSGISLSYGVWGMGYALHHLRESICS